MRISFFSTVKCTLLLLSALFMSSRSFATNPEPQTGKASYYADYFEGRKTAYGEPYRRAEMTAAHKTLPFGTVVKVTHLGNGNSVIVRINDRGPFVKGRIIDLSRRAAEELGLVLEGVALVKIEIVNPDGNAEAPEIASAPAEPLAPASLQPDATAVQAESSLQDRLTAAQLPFETAPTQGFSLEIGQYHHLGNIRSVYLSLGSLSNEPMYITEGTDFEGRVYHVRIGLGRTREEMEQLLKDPGFRFTEAEIVDWEAEKTE